MPVRDRRYENLFYFILGGIIWLILAYMVFVAIIQVGKHLLQYL